MCPAFAYLMMGSVIMPLLLGSVTSVVGSLPGMVASSVAGMVGMVAGWVAWVVGSVVGRAASVGGVDILPFMFWRRQPVSILHPSTRARAKIA